MRIKRNLEPGAVIQPELWVTPGQKEEAGRQEGRMSVERQGSASRLEKELLGF